MSDHPMTTPTTQRAASLPPKPLIRAAWIAHRAILRLTGGRKGLWPATATKWGAMRLTTVGRRSGLERVAILGYYEDGPNLVTMAMNGWMAPEPAWWLNLQAHPDATVQLRGEIRRVHARAAQGEERARLWARWQAIDGNLEAYAARRPNETAIVILEPAAQPA